MKLIVQTPSLVTYLLLTRVLLLLNCWLVEVQNSPLFMHWMVLLKKIFSSLCRIKSVIMGHQNILPQMMPLCTKDPNFWSTYVTYGSAYGNLNHISKTKIIQKTGGKQWKWWSTASSILHQHRNVYGSLLHYMLHSALITPLTLRSEMVPPLRISTHQDGLMT